MKKSFNLLIFITLSLSLIGQVESRYQYYPGQLLRDNFESEAWTTTLNGTATDVTYSNGAAAFNGSSSKVVYPIQVGVKSVRLKITSLNSTTQNILKLSSTHSITISSGTISATGFSSPTIYVNGSAGSTITTAGGEIVVTTETAITANDIQLGYFTGYLNGSVTLFELYNVALPGGDVYNLWQGSPTYSVPIGGDYAYGVQFDLTNTSPDGTRIGVLASHVTLPVHSLMKACLLQDNGTVNYYLDPTDWSKKADGSASDLDGDDGQVMIEIPRHYYKYEQVGNNLRIYVSPVHTPGFTEVPKFYIGAYKAALNRSTNKLASVVNATTTYRGGNNNAAWDAADYTLLGKPATSLTRANYRTYAGNRGSGWTQNVQWQRDAVYRLFTVEYATSNSQKAVNTALDGSGYRQGGLGDGVTNLVSAEWNTYNGYYPVIPCGQSNSLASGSGEVSYTIPGYTGTSATKVNRYRGIENPFGDIWEFVDGVNIYVDASFNGEIYVKRTAIFTDDTSTGYTRQGTLPAVSGYITTLNNLVMLPSAIGGGAATYWADYFYVSGSASVWRVVLVGGIAIDGSAAGLGCVASTYSSSNANTNIGSRLCYYNGL